MEAQYTERNGVAVLSDTDAANDNAMQRVTFSSEGKHLSLP